MRGWWSVVKWFGALKRIEKRGMDEEDQQTKGKKILYNRERTTLKIGVYRVILVHDF